MPRASISACRPEGRGWTRRYFLQLFRDFCFLFGCRFSVKKVYDIGTFPQQTAVGAVLTVLKRALWPERPASQEGDQIAMQKKIFVGTVLIICLIIAGYVVLYFVLKKTSFPAVVDGPRVTIDAGSNHIEGVLEPQATYQFLLKDEGISINTYAGDAFVTVLSLEEADRLKAQYGDFFTCNEPGALLAIQKMKAVVLVAANDQTKRTVAEAMALVRQSRIPTVRFKGSRIQVLKYTYLNMEVNDQAGTPLYYLNDMVILRPDYME